MGEISINYIIMQYALQYIIISHMSNLPRCWKAWTNAPTPALYLLRWHSRKCPALFCFDMHGSVRRGACKLLTVLHYKRFTFALRLTDNISDFVCDWLQRYNKYTTNPQHVDMSRCCGFVVQQAVLQQIHNKSNKWSLSINVDSGLLSVVHTDCRNAVIFAAKLFLDVYV